MSLPTIQTCSAMQCIALVLLLVGLTSRAFALPMAVLSNFSQLAFGGYLTLTSQQYIAVPFVTDTQFLQLDGVEINAATLLLPG